MSLSVKLRAALLAAACIAATPAFAQDGEERGWVVTLGPGAAYVPKFPGADELELRFWPIIGVRRAGSEPRFETPDQSFGVSVLRSPSFRVGPALNIERGRDKDDVPGLGKVKTSFEAGGFAEAFLGENFRIRGEVRKGVSGHKGLVADIGADAIIGSPSDTFHFSIGPRARIVDDRYMRAFFGVDAEQATASGFPVYDPDGGFHSAGALAFANYKVSEAIGLMAYGRYDRLMGDAKDSPLVLSEYGSRDQYQAGIGITYTFTVR